MWSEKLWNPSFPPALIFKRTHWLFTINVSCKYFASAYIIFKYYKQNLILLIPLKSSVNKVWHWTSDERENSSESKKPVHINLCSCDGLIDAVIYLPSEFLGRGKTIRLIISSSCGIPADILIICRFRGNGGSAHLHFLQSIFNHLDKNDSLCGRVLVTNPSSTIRTENELKIKIGKR